MLSLLLMVLQLQSPDKHLLGQANQINGVENAKEAVWLWHCHLRHLSFRYLKKLQPQLFSVVSDLDFHCDICELAKSHRISYSPSLNKSPIPFMKIHSDVEGLVKIPSLSGARYFVTFIDDCTRMTWVSLLKNKCDVFGMFAEFHKMVTTQYQQSIRVFQSDNGGEFVNGPMIEFCRSHGIRYQTSNSYTPQQNGLAERKNRQLMEVVRASLFGMNVPRSYWGEAVKSAAYLINRTPSRVIEFQNPHQKLHTLLTIPSMPNLEPQVFGCIAYVHIPKPQRNKLDPRARKCIFVGYANFQKGYRCYGPLTGTLHVSLDVAFRESEPYYSGGVSQSSLQGERALKDPKGTKEMNEELEALQKNATWELVPMPVGKKTVGCRWNAFLNGNLEEEVYIDVPPGVKNYPSDVGKVCKLKKSLYGLKQSPRAWFGRFSKSMKAFGYRQSNSDHTLFIKCKNGKITALIVYIDDMIVTGDDPKEMNELQKYLSKEFEMKDLGQLKYFLGIEVARSKKGILLSQRKYVIDLLAETGMLDCRPMETPIEMNHRLAIYPDQVPTDKGRYQRLVGRLIYLSHTRPDIAYAHMDAVFRILKYLKMAPGKGLLFQKKDELEVVGYTDADGLVIKLTSVLHLGTSLLLEGTLSLGVAKSKKLLPDQVQKLSSEVWHTEVVLKLCHCPLQHDRSFSCLVRIPVTEFGWRCFGEAKETDRVFERVEEVERWWSGMVFD
ncbi:putative RNA-directed DNA polymerase [Rosa chinensis]|uniref:Putative RNA-directed DNA polymerase n=1 Tax=Rosa chinensis TaxID=74649 RepID=A0A2P6P7K6_ROSCH|nr:putative RNA-directed DNA polymerase [Rosa chinensis]